ncbi:RGN.2 family protein [Megaselia abdita]
MLRSVFVVLLLSVVHAIQDDKKSYNIEVVPNSRANLGEGPHWDIEAQSLYYVDIYAGKLLRYSWDDDKIFSCLLENGTISSFIIPVKHRPNHFVIGDERKIKIVQWDGITENCSTIETIGIVEQNNTLYDFNGFNDGKCDPRGRLFTGTTRYIGDILEFRRGSLYKWTDDGMRKLAGNIGVSNGLAWNKRSHKIYYIDSADKNVVEYHYDLRRGIPMFNTKREVFKIEEVDNNGQTVITDGMTIDDRGDIYVALYRGSSLVKVDPRRKTILEKLSFPSKLVTSAAFGGPNLDTLFVTSGREVDDIEEAGFLYKVKGLGKGLPMNKFEWK